MTLSSIAEHDDPAAIFVCGERECIIIICNALAALCQRAYAFGCASCLDLLTIYVCMHGGQAMCVCRVQLRWPKAQGEAHRARTGNLAMLRSWLQEAAPAVVSSLPLNQAVQVCRC